MNCLKLNSVRPIKYAMRMCTHTYCKYIKRVSRASNTIFTKKKKKMSFNT